MSDWTPSDQLVLDLRHALAHAPRETAEDRFEAWAWRALLDEDGPALLTRRAVPSHITASAIVLSSDLSRTAMVLHGKMHAWVQPGGHLEEPDTTLASAAAREVAEETGLRVQVHPDPVKLSRHRAPCRPGVVDWHLDVQFAAIAEDGQALSVSHESDDVAWFDLGDLPTDLAPGAAASIEVAVTALRRAWAGTADGAQAGVPSASAAE